MSAAPDPATARRATPLAQQRAAEEAREASLERQWHRLLSHHGADTLSGLRGEAATQGYALLRQAPNAYMRCLFNRMAVARG
jgi:hypothetical protein